MAMFPHLAVPISTEPMEARLVAELPTGDEWQFEPKWDGFRCLAFRDGDEVALMSKSGKPLGRYFPEIVAAVLQLSESRLVLDGELVLPRGESLSFADLQLRLHPSASRVARLSRETPARLMLFDCLQCGDAVLIDAPLDRRRTMLEELAARGLPALLRLSPATSEAVSKSIDWLMVAKMPLRISSLMTSAVLTVSASARSVTAIEEGSSTGPAGRTGVVGASATAAAPPLRRRGGRGPLRG